MDLKHKLVGVGVALLAVAGFGTATAVAQTSGPSTQPTRVSPPETVTTPEPAHAADTDNVQQGRPEHADTGETDHADGKADAPETGEQADPADKTQGADGNDTGESAGSSGGHQDPPGSIDNQQRGQH